MNLDLDKLEQAALAATPGPWKVIADEHAHHLGGKHTERRIFTDWDHPQLKGPVGVVNSSRGIAEKKGDPAIWMVSLDAEDADYISAVNPAVVLELVRQIRVLKEQADALHKIGGALGLLAGADLTTEAAPAVEDLVRRLRAAEADAARYQYIRDEAWKRNPGLQEGGRAGLMMGRHGEELDSAVDIARAAQGGSHG